jgi:hypothetical protein
MSHAEQQSAQEDESRREGTEYFVNGEEQETDEHKLSVKAILELAGFTPASDWVLARDSDGHEFQDQDELVPIRENERFTATHDAPTPAS